jgi:dTDP-4-amino-4,6-dideoxygalactose transaminase
MIRTKKCEIFEKNFAYFLGAEDCVSVSSFRMGLYHALKALELNHGDEVLLSPITIPDTINIILLLGLRPVFVDMSLEDHALDLLSLKTKKNKNSRVVLLTHLSGIPANVIEIQNYCKSEKLFLIEDFSQNVGGRFQGRALGLYGDVGICSLSRGKTLTSMAGGLVVSKNLRLMEKMRSDIHVKLSPSKAMFKYYLKYNFKINLITSKYFFNFFSFFAILFLAKFRPSVWLSIEPEEQKDLDIFYDNVPVLRSEIPKAFFSFFSDWQADIASELLLDLELNNGKRRELARFLLDNCKEEVKRHIPSSLINHFESNTIYHFPINSELSVRNKLLKHLIENGVDSAGYGLNLCSEEKIFNDYHCKLPGAEAIKHASIFIPIHESFDNKDMLTIAYALNSFYT